MKARNTRFLNDSGPRGAKKRPEVLMTSQFRSYRLLNLYEEAMLEGTCNQSLELSQLRVCRHRFRPSSDNL